MKKHPANPILVVDNEIEFLRSIELLLLSHGYSNVITCADGRDVSSILERERISLALLDIQMPHVTGKELLEHLGQEFPDVPVLMITADTDVRTAVECMKKGAYDYLVKPVDPNDLDAAIKRALEKTSFMQEISSLRKHMLAPVLEHPEAFAPIITNNERMISIFRYVEAIASSPQPVIVTGDTGSGKELIARILHELSGRAGEFVPVNIAGLDDTLFSDTLFGHKKGAYTGADAHRSGFVEKAAGGTLFLDEIGDLSMQSQVKLLRLIQENEFHRLGSDTTEKSDVRIIAATNCNLETLMQEKKFRNDLYHRLRIHRIVLPPLRERPGDLGLLVEHFVAEAAAMYKKEPLPVDPATLSLLASYRFPGNLRELRAIIIEAVCLTNQGTIMPETVRPLLEGGESGPSEGAGDRDPGGLPKVTFPLTLPTLKQMEKILINEAMRRSANVQSRAARLLGISHQAVSKRLQTTEESCDSE